MSTQVSASIVANRMYAFGETYDQAKAWALANLAADATGLDAVETDIETMGAQALEDRAIAWYVRETLFADLPASSSNLQTVPGLSTAGHDGDVVTVQDGAFVLGAGGGGGGLTGVGAFDTTPNADGLSVTTGDVSLSLGDATHPGGVSPTEPAYVDGLTSTLGGLFTGTPAAGSAHGVAFGEDPAFAAAAIWLGETTLDIAHAWLYRTGGNGLTFNCPGAIAFQNNGVTQATLGTAGLDMSGMLPGAYLKMKSPDGTIWTITVDNAGNLVVA